MKKLVAMVSMYQSGQFIENKLINLTESKAASDTEIWCLNANSPDERDREIPKKFNVKYIELKERNTVYQAWNHIIKESQSQYITNANTDDIVSPDCYNRMFQVLDTSDASFTYCDWYVTAKENQKWESKTDYEYTGKTTPFHGDVATSVVGHFPMWRRDLHKKLGHFDERFKALGDAEWWARCYYKLAAKFVNIREPLGLYLYRNGQNLWHKSISTEEWQMFHKTVQGYKECQK